jgi:hypothetical protein
VISRQHVPQSTSCCLGIIDVAWEHREMSGHDCPLAMSGRLQDTQTSCWFARRRGIGRDRVDVTTVPVSAPTRRAPLMLPRCVPHSCRWAAARWVRNEATRSARCHLAGRSMGGGRRCRVKKREGATRAITFQRRGRYLPPSHSHLTRHRVVVGPIAYAGASTLTTRLNGITRPWARTLSWRFLSDARAALRDRPSGRRHAFAERSVLDARTAQRRTSRFTNSVVEGTRQIDPAEP